MRFLYDDQADALYIRLQENVRVARSVIVDEERVVDVDDHGKSVGIEILGASRGVRLTDLIPQFGLEEFARNLMILEKHHFRSVEFA